MNNQSLGKKMGLRVLPRMANAKTLAVWSRGSRQQTQLRGRRPRGGVTSKKGLAR